MKPYEKFFEKVYGNNAIVYHRTKLASISSIVKSGFASGSGSMYGNGLYSTYDLDSQLQTHMESLYGNVIIKFKINLNRFLILDYDQARTVYKDKYTLIDQIKALNIPPEKIEEIHVISLKLEKADYTSEYALEILKDSSMKNKINGMIFTGRQDGRVAVLYNPDIAVPISYAATLQGDVFLNPSFDLSILKYLPKESYSKVINENKIDQTGAWVKVTSFENIKKSIEALDKTKTPPSLR